MNSTVFHYVQAQRQADLDRELTWRQREVPIDEAMPEATKSSRLVQAFRWVAQPRHRRENLVAVR
jgi:hypothetical protein